MIGPAGRRVPPPSHVFVLGIVGLEIAYVAFVILASLGNPSFGLDYRWHMAATRRMLETGTPYLPWQLAGPYEIGNGAILYPPTTFALFLPFLVLPAATWWLIPIAVTVAAMSRHRPPAWTWPLTVGLFCLDKSLNVYVFGNPTMWVVAAVAAGTVLHWPFALVIGKPTFAPLALLGVRHRSWWVALLAVALLSVPFWHMWVDWFAVVTNSNVTVWYNLPTVPLVVAPLVPWMAVALASRRGGARSARGFGHALGG